MTLFSATLKGIDKAFKNFEKQQNTATFRTLNIQSNRALKVVSKKINQSTGIKQSTIRKSVKISKATKFSSSITWLIKGKRLNLTKPRQLKRGVSFTGKGKSRKKIVDNINGGSKPFIIKGKNSGKNIAVYRTKGLKRKVTALKGNSIPFLFGIIGIDEEQVRKLIMKDIAKEYSKQLRRAGFTKKTKNIILTKNS